MAQAASTSGRIVGRYVLSDEIASGGMATVHLGRLLGPVGFARTVAIKRLHAQLACDPEFVAMFLDEARLAARISHPNVVSTIDVVATHGELFLVMEYVQGESLSRLFRAVAMPGRLPVPIALSIACDTLYGLHAAHEARGENGDPLDIVHRDVSPHNIMVARDGVSRVLDFGIAKAAARAGSTRDGEVKGKLAYMAPEQLRRETVDRRTDVFAASIVLWESLTGERLFHADDHAAIVARVLLEPIAPPSARAPDVPCDLDAVVLKGLAREPNGRFATAHAMASELEKLGPARPAQVAAWIESIAKGVLDVRAARVAQIEGQSVGEAHGLALEPAPAEIPTQILEEPAAFPLGAREPPAQALPAAGHRTRARFVVAAIVVASSVVVAGVAGSGRSEKRPSESHTASASPLVAPSQVPAVLPEPASAAPSASGTPPVASSVVRAPATAPGRVRPRCEPPYYFDGDGVKRFKQGCI